MSLSGSFQNFSLAEVFKVIDQGHKSGCLTVSILPDSHVPQAKPQDYYIWFLNGRMMAAANRFDGNCLASKILEKRWVSKGTLARTYRSTSSDIPLGLQLKIEGLLSSEQLNLLFASQMYQVQNLFEITQGVFKFDGYASVPASEMTGISSGAIEVALSGLRELKNWQPLAHVLPNSNSAIKHIVGKLPQIRLNAFDRQIEELAQGNLSLEEIAKKLHQPTTKVQQAAFRLMLAGLVEEVTVVHLRHNEHKDFQFAHADGAILNKPSQSGVNISFLQNLVGFLRSKF
jgi:hypothetical protein